MTRVRLIHLLPLAVLLAAAVAGAVFMNDHLTYRAIEAHREALLAYRDAHYAATLLIFMLAYVAVVALSLPWATAFTLTGGFLFGLFPGVLYNLAAASIGATLIFFAVRMGLGKWLSAWLAVSEGRMARVKRAIDANRWSVLFVMRLSPVFPFFVANVVSALLNVPTGVFLVTTVLGIIPGSLVYTSVGAGLGEVFARGEAPDLDVIFEPYILGPILGLLALAALPIVLKALRRDHGL